MFGVAGGLLLPDREVRRVYSFPKEPSIWLPPFAGSIVVNGPTTMITDVDQARRLFGEGSPITRQIEVILRQADTPDRLVRVDLRFGFGGES